MLGIIDILCRGDFIFPSSGSLAIFCVGFIYLFKAATVFLRLRVFLLREVHDVCWGLLIFCVVVYYIS